MIKCILAVGGSKAMLDARNNQASIVGIIEEVSSQGFPTSPFNIDCLYFLTRDESDPASPESSLVVKLNGDQIFKNPVRVGFGENLRTRTFVTLNGIVATHPGTLEFELECNGSIVGSWTAQVKKIEKAEPQMPLINSN